MPRRYTRSGRYTRRVKTIKYSNETYNYNGTLIVNNSSQKTDWHQTLITAIDQQGVRKCKNFELTLTGSAFTPSAEGANIPSPLFYALVYVPQGTEASRINIGSPDACASLYEPNQNVIMSGVWPGDLTAPFVKKTRLARNLNSGDSIQLILSSPPFDSAGVAYEKMVAVTLNYAISF
ncbi:hypothetical protein [Circoviridae sp.]|nr:hypothetical protein [Circoviridae sp.]UNO37826.1 hypothetical protein [Po-Circo-like virus]